MLVRASITITLMLVSALYLNRSDQVEQIPLRESLHTLPMRIGVWRGENLPNFDPKVETVLGVDEYANRYYHHDTLPPVSLYVGYYQSQRQGDTIHSPLNCLPGAGWEPTRHEHIQLSMPGDAGEPALKTVEINRLVIRKGLDRQVVLYWYQTHNRVIASEYWGKIYTVLDAIRYNRTDAALVRIISPVLSADTEQASEKAATEFAQALLPMIAGYLPSSHLN